MTPTRLVTMLASASVACGGPAGAPQFAQASANLVAGNAGALFADSVTRPAGGVFLATHLWESDNLEYFVRIDPAANGVAQPDQFFRATGIADGTDLSGPTASHLNKPGAPAYDAASGYVYVPDFASKGSGVWRFPFDAAAERVATVGTIVAPSAGLGGLRPTSVALGPDGNLYVGSLNTPDVKRINAPVAAAQTVQTIGKATGRRIFGVAFLGADLYLAESNGLSVIRGATRCQSGCNAVPVSGVPIVEADGIVAADVDTLYFIQAPQVMRYTASTGTLEIFAGQGTLPDGYVPMTSHFADAASGCIGQTCSFTFAAGQPNLIAVDGAGGLLVGEDPGTLTLPNASPFCGRIWRFSN